MNLEEMKCTKRRIELLNRMGIYSVEELLRTYPTRYETIQSTPFLEWKENDMVCFEGLICKQAYVVRLSKNRSMTKFKVISWDEELEITLSFLSSVLDIISSLPFSFITSTFIPGF